MIQVEKLTKRYRGGKGIKNVGLDIKRGDAFGFLGPNGAGKTTTIRILMGLIKADSGTARINGLDCWEKRTELKRLIGYLPGELNFFEHFSGRELLELLRKMHDGSRDTQSRAAQLAERFNLDTRQLIRKMSKGMKQKLGIIAALMHNAEVLILDEPTSGLDPLMQKEFVHLLREEKEQGKTILLCSHQFEEVEQICKSVGIIRDGQLLAVQAIAELKRMEYHHFEIEVESEEDAGVLQENGFTSNGEKNSVFQIKIAGDLNGLWAALSQVRVKKFSQRFLELEEAFIHFYE